MGQPKNAMEVFKLLDKSNCRECGEKTCLAFAGAVFQGKRCIGDCPKLDPAIVKRFGGTAAKPSAIEDNREVYLETIKHEITNIDLAAAANRIGARFADGRLTLRVLGKKFSVDSRGGLSADIHINPWVAIPFLDYIINGSGLQPSGNWVTFRELDTGAERYPLFQKRCEAPIKQVADVYPDLFSDMVHIFSGKRVEKQFQSDISVVLQPLPRVPIMVCYWLPEGDLQSSLNIFFDDTADKNLDIGRCLRNWPSATDTPMHSCIDDGQPQAIRVFLRRYCAQYGCRCVPSITCMPSDDIS